MAGSQAQEATSPRPAADAPESASPKSAASPRSATEAAGDNRVHLEVDYVGWSARVPFITTGD